MATWILASFALLWGQGPLESGEGAVYPNGEVNGDGRTDLADPVYLLRYLFGSGPAPIRYLCEPCDSCCPEAYRPLSTGITRCLDPDTREWLDDYPKEGEPGYGQDGTYQAGVSRRGQYRVVTFDDADDTRWITVDYATGLMWQYRAGSFACEGRELGLFSDWRFPNIFELLSLLSYPLRAYPDPARPDLYPALSLYAAMDPYSFYLFGDKTGLISMRYRSSTFALPLLHIYGANYREGTFSDSLTHTVRCVRSIEEGDLELLGLPAVWAQVNEPLENGDANGDRKMDVADAVFLLQHLFMGGPRPFDVVCGGCDTCCMDFPARPLKTGMKRCFVGQIEMACDRPEVVNQDGASQAGVAREFRLATQSSEDRREWMTADLVTGLLWQYSSSAGEMTWSEALDHCEGLELGGFSDWRLPNFFEFMTLINFGKFKPSPTYFEYFGWPEPVAWPHWTSTPIADKWQQFSGRADTIICVYLSEDVRVMTLEPTGTTYVKAVRTLKSGDLESLGLR